MSGDDFDRHFDVVAEPRRRWSLAEKRRIVEEARGACTNVSAVARRHGIKRALLYRWKKELAGDATAAPTLLSVALTSASDEDDEEGPGPAASNGPVFMVEIELGNGRTIRVPPQIDVEALKRLINVLEH
jgi:transposase-like protein